MNDIKKYPKFLAIFFISEYYIPNDHSQNQQADSTLTQGESNSSWVADDGKYSIETAQNIFGNLFKIFVDKKMIEACL